MRIYYDIKRQFDTNVLIVTSKILQVNRKRFLNWRKKLFVMGINFSS